MKLETTPGKMLLIGFISLVWVLNCPHVATADPYDSSAHGNTTYGVNRSGAGYDIGECAHCHDTFNDSICGVNNLMLFKTEYFCVQCHQYPGTSYQVDMPYQGNYSRRIGGDTSNTCPAYIKQAFLFVDQTTGTGLPVLNCGSDKGSSHNIADIADFLQGRWGFSDTADDINSCNACHNPHLAKQDYPCSLPSNHSSGTAWEVWGDEAGEKMSDLSLIHI